MTHQTTPTPPLPPVRAAARVRERVLSLSLVTLLPLGLEAERKVKPAR